jgi:hypothetical protein
MESIKNSLQEIDETYGKGNVTYLVYMVSNQFEDIEDSLIGCFPDFQEASEYSESLHKKLESIANKGLEISNRNDKEEILKFAEENNIMEILGYDTVRVVPYKNGGHLKI